MTSSTFVFVLALVIAAAVGAAVAWVLAGARAAAARHRLELVNASLTEQAKHAEEMTVKEVERRKADAAVLACLDPMRTSLDELRRRTDDANRARAQAEAALAEQLRNGAEQTRQATTEVQAQARKLTQALTSTNVRGFWGEAQLRSLVEDAGMLQRVHFETQVQLAGADSSGRADMVIKLAGGREVVVDAKAPLDALMSSADGPDGYPPEVLASHAKALQAHVDTLAKRNYWSARESLVDFVVLYLPAESLLGLALAADPGLVARAAQRRVILATPTTMLGLLRTVEFGWRQETLAQNAEQIRDVGKELYDRLAVFLRHFDSVGKGLTSAVNAYNKGIGSVDSRLMPTARRMAELGVSSEALPDLNGIEVATRTLSAPEAGTVLELPAEAPARAG